MLSSSLPLAYRSPDPFQTGTALQVLGQQQHFRENYTKSPLLLRVQPGEQDTGRILTPFVARNQHFLSESLLVLV